MFEQLTAFGIVGGGLLVGIAALLVRDWWQKLRPQRRCKIATVALLGTILCGIGAPAAFALMIDRTSCRGCNWGTRSRNNLRQICTALHLYADDNGSKFPACDTSVKTLVCIWPKYLTDHRALTIGYGKGGDPQRLLAALNSSPVTDLSDIDYMYVPNCEQTDGDKILVYERVPHNGCRSFALVDGSAATLPENEFMDRLKKQLRQDGEPEGLQKRNK